MKKKLKWYFQNEYHPQSSLLFLPSRKRQNFTSWTYLTYLSEVFFNTPGNNI